MASTPAATASRVTLNLLLAMSVLAFVVFGLGPHTGAYRTLTVLSDSMQPEFGAGDVVVLVPTRSDALLPGDVISYRAPGEGGPVVTHRIVEVVRRGAHPVLRTKGDANRSSDPWTVRLDDRIVWRHRLTIPHVGVVNRAFRIPVVKLVTVYLLPLALVVAGLAVIWARPPQDGRDVGVDDEWDLPLPDIDDPAWVWWDGDATPAVAPAGAQRDRWGSVA